MGFVVLVMCSPILIPLVIIMFILGLKGDEWFNHQPPRKRRVYYYDEIDEKDLDDDMLEYYGVEKNDFISDSSDCIDSSDSELYGGLPYGDGEIFIVDNEDMIDQMDF